MVSCLVLPDYPKPIGDVFVNGNDVCCLPKGATTSETNGQVALQVREHREKSRSQTHDDGSPCVLASFFVLVGLLCDALSAFFSAVDCVVGDWGRQQSTGRLVRWLGPLRHFYSATGILERLHLLSTTIYTEETTTDCLVLRWILFGLRCGSRCCHWITGKGRQSLVGEFCGHSEGKRVCLWAKRGGVLLG